VRSRRRWKAVVGVTIAIGVSWVISGPLMFGQEAQSAPAASSAGDSSSPLPNQPDANSLFGAPDNVPPSVAPSGRGLGRGQRGSQSNSQVGFGSSGGDPLFPGGSTRGYSAGNGAGTGTGSFDWTKLFDTAVRSGFQFASPRLFASGGMRPMGGGTSLFDMGDGLLRSTGGASSGVLGSSLDLASEAARIDRRGLNLTLKEPDKNSDLGVRFSFQEAMGHNSLLGGGGMGGGGSFGGGGNSFGSMNSFGSGNSFGSPGSSNMFGPGNGMGGGKRGGSGGSGSQVSVQFKF
jgi:hypothetical protein